MRFSLIMCTYNPERKIFDRSVNACIALVKRHEDVELIIVDNNSEPPLVLEEHWYTNSGNRVRLITEKRQGQAYARVTGLAASGGQWIIFADDDNEPDATYLSALEALIIKYPNVAAWGPGTLSVEFVNSCPRWINKNFRHLYQERKLAGVKFGNEKGWPPYFPPGSGLALRRSVCEDYRERFDKGELNATGRKGRILSSGEDSQLVWTAVKMGFDAGMSDSLRLNHLIPQSRCTLDYLVRLQYGLAYSYCFSLSEMFPEQKQTLRPLSILGKVKVFFQVFLQVGLKPLLFYRKYLVTMAWFKGVKDWAAKS